MVDYAVVSNVITDDIILADGTEYVGLLGGAATYAAAGMRVWSPSVGLLSGVGADCESLHGVWFRQADIDTRGLLVRDVHTPHSWVRYFADGERTETPQFGPAHFHLMETTPADLPPDYRLARGVYLFRDDAPRFWDDLDCVREQLSGVLLWEIAANVTDAAHWQRVSEIASKLDLFSLNLSEGRQLCGVDEPERIVDRLLSIGIRAVALRMGARGALVADASAIWQVPSVPTQVVDVTGAGNAFSAAFLVGYCESDEDVRTAGIYGSVAASFAVEQYGPPPFDSTLHERALARARALEPVRVRS